MFVYHLNKNRMNARSFPYCMPWINVEVPTFTMAPAIPKVVLEYSLKSVDDALVFQVTEQSKAISDFLKKNRFQASNGMIIAADEYPEIKDSTNHIYLRGSNSVKDLKLDVTRFVGKKQLENKEAIIRAALKEFVEFIGKSVKASYRPVYVF